jgi:hypothetical protein
MLYYHARRDGCICIEKVKKKEEKEKKAID